MYVAKGECVTNRSLKFAVLRPESTSPDILDKPEGAAKRPPWQSWSEPVFTGEAVMS